MRHRAKKDPIEEMEKDLLRAKIRLEDTKRRLDMTSRGLDPDEEPVTIRDFSQ